MNLFSEAVECPHWSNAMISEIEALKLNNTWSLFDHPHGKQPTGC